MSLSTFTTASIVLTSMMTASFISPCPAQAIDSGVVDRHGVADGLSVQLEDEALTEDERQGLLSMLSEEKLAHDVYLALGEKYPMRMFENIRRAETRHMAALAALMTRLGLEVDSADLPAGEFADEEVTTLYEQLVERGLESRVEAMRVGAMVEEMDIKDLRTAAAQTEREDILAVYAQLERGSRNHLRAFMRQLDRMGETYEPQFLTEEEFQEIIDGDHERGR